MRNSESWEISHGKGKLGVCGHEWGFGWDSGIVLLVVGVKFVRMVH